jgi:hypothetical protein
MTLLWFGEEPQAKLPVLVSPNPVNRFAFAKALQEVASWTFNVRNVI